MTLWESETRSDKIMQRFFEYCVLTSDIIIPSIGVTECKMPEQDGFINMHVLANKENIDVFGFS